MGQTTRERNCCLISGCLQRIQHCKKRHAFSYFLNMIHQMTVPSCRVGSQGLLGALMARRRLRWGIMRACLLSQSQPALLGWQPSQRSWWHEKWGATVGRIWDIVALSHVVWKALASNMYPAVMSGQCAQHLQGSPGGRHQKMTNLTWKVSEEFDAILSPNGSSDGAYFSPGRPGQMGDHTTNIYNAINHFTNIRFGE